MTSRANRDTEPLKPWQTSVINSDTSSSPQLTPAGTPPTNPCEKAGGVEEDFATTMGDAKEEAAEKSEREQQQPDEGPKADDRTEPSKPDVGPSKAAEAKTGPKMGKKGTCKHQKNQKKKSKRKVKIEESSSSEDTLSDSSSDDGSEEPSDSSSESDGDSKKAQKRKAKAKKAKKLKAKKKAAKKARQEDSDSDSDSGDDSSSSEDEKPRSKKKKSTRKSKQTKKKIAVSDSDEDCSEDAITQKIQRLQALKGIGSSSRAAEASSKKSKKKPKKRGSKMAFVRVDRTWDKSRHNYVLKPTAEDIDVGEYDQYAFQVRRIFDWENKYLHTVVDIKSRALKDALKDVMGDVKGISLAEESPEIDPNMLFLYLEELRTHLKRLRKMIQTEKKKKKGKVTAKTKYLHGKVLVKYLDEDYADIKKRLYPLLENNTITFDLLWALFKSNEIAYCATYSNVDEPRAFKIEYANLHSSYVKGKYYNIEGRYLEYDGKFFGRGSIEMEVSEFKGPRKITSLDCYPLKYHKDADELKKTLIERGKKFVGLKGMQYRFHKGMAFYKKKRQVVKVNINGRVMVDPAIHRRINPNYPISNVKPPDPDILDSSDDSDSDECCGCESSSDEEGLGQKANDQFGNTEKPKVKWKLIEDEHGCVILVQVEIDEDGNVIQKEDINTLPGQENLDNPEFMEEDFLIASPVVLGFAFSEKLWLELTVSGINPIDWNEDAYDSLVIKEDQKSIVKALVQSHTFEGSRNIDDVIQGKGRGLVAVLHGPPGTGKTLTAEGIAELLKRPLYMVSVGELGTRPDQLEYELNKILDVAHSWGAVLLLDEADVFLEARQPQDVGRNALVSVFLRLLEYFQGILFLTTNRVETFDPAFQSRIHVALRYGELTSAAKKSVWKTFLEKVNAIEGVEIDKFTDEDYERLSRRNLNGRQIKNAVRTAQALALNEKNKLDMAKISKVLDVAETFERDLKGGTGYEDAMRSYH